MNARHPLISALIPLALAACSAASSADPDPLGAPADDSEDVGVATAAVSVVPVGVACIDIQVVGTRTVTRRFDVTAGKAALVSLGGLPLGSVTFSGVAFGSACSVVNASTAATWVSDPVTTALASGTSPKVDLAFHAAASANVGATFDGAASASPIGVSPIAFGFPAMDCGASMTQAITVSNSATTPFNVTASVSGGAFSLSTHAFPIGPSTTAQVLVTALPGMPGPISSTLTIQSDSLLDSPHYVYLTGLVAGNILKFQPGTLSGNGVVQLVNSGNAPAPFTIPVPAGYTVTPSSGMVAAGASLSINVQRSLLTTGTTLTANVASGRCGPDPRLTVL